MVPNPLQPVLSKSLTFNDALNDIDEFIYKNSINIPQKISFSEPFQNTPVSVAQSSQSTPFRNITIGGGKNPSPSREINFSSLKKATQQRDHQLPIPPLRPSLTPISHNPAQLSPMPTISLGVPNPPLNNLNVHNLNKFNANNFNMNNYNVNNVNSYNVNHNFNYNNNNNYNNNGDIARRVEFGTGRV